MSKHNPQNPNNAGQQNHPQQHVPQQEQAQQKPPPQQQGHGTGPTDPVKARESVNKGGHVSHAGGQKQPPQHGFARDDHAHEKRGKDK